VRGRLFTAACTALVVVVLYSCSLHAAVTTDGDGRVVEVSAWRLESSISRLAVAMLLAGGQLAVELRWKQAASDRAKT